MTLTDFSIWFRRYKHLSPTISYSDDGNVQFLIKVESGIEIYTGSTLEEVFDLVYGDFPLRIRV